MPRLVHICTFLILAGLTLPGIGYLLGTGTSEGYIESAEHRRATSFPGWPDLGHFGQWSAQADQAIIDQFPFRGSIIQAVRFFDMTVGGRRVFGDVTLGRDGWLFFRADFGNLLRGESYVTQFHDRLERLFKYADSVGKPLLVIVIPPKQELYFEQLRPADRAYMARNARLRKQFYDGLERFPAKRVPRVWSQLKALKDDSGELVYHPQDTHYTHVGAMLVARNIVDSLSPGLWDENALKNSRGQPGFGDLVGMAGFGSGWKNWEVVVSSISRPGVSLQSRELLSAADTPTSPIRYHMKSEPGVPLIPGKTLIMHDSYIGGFLREPLAQYFADVTYIHIDDLGRIDMETEMAGFDRVVLQMNERNALTVLAMIHP